MKAYQMKNVKYACPGSALWVPVEIPVEVMDSIRHGKEYSGGLYWGRWNRGKSGMWPDWIVVMEEGSRRRVRWIHDAPDRCPAGPCGESKEYVLFSAAVAAEVDLEEKVPGEMSALADGTLPIYEEVGGISFLWEGNLQKVGSPDELEAFFQELGFASFQEEAGFSSSPGDGSFCSTKVADLPKGSFRVTFKETRGPGWRRSTSRVFVNQGEVRVASHSSSGNRDTARGEIYKVENGVASKVGTYDPQEKEKKEFAAAQRQITEKLGFSERATLAIMRAAGPGRMVEAATIAVEIIAKIGSGDAADAFGQALEHVAQGGEVKYGKDRKRAAAVALGLPEISGNAESIGKVLRGVAVAIRAGVRRQASSETEAA